MCLIKWLWKIFWASTSELATIRSRQDREKSSLLGAGPPRTQTRILFLFAHATRDPNLPRDLARNPQMTISSIYILDSQGKKLILRDYRGDIDTKTAIETFVQEVVEAPDNADQKPIFQKDDIHYTYIKHNNIFRTSKGFGFFFHNTRRNSFLPLQASNFGFSAIIKLDETFEYFSLKSRSINNACECRIHLNFVSSVVAVTRINADATTAVLLLYNLVKVRICPVIRINILVRRKLCDIYRHEPR